MGVLRVGICDDGSAICSEIERIVKEYGKKHDLRLDTEIWSTGEALVDYLEDGNAIDLLFLDTLTNWNSVAVIDKLVRM